MCWICENANVGDIIKIQGFEGVCGNAGCNAEYKLKNVTLQWIGNGVDKEGYLVHVFPHERVCKKCKTKNFYIGMKCTGISADKIFTQAKKELEERK